jgi:hypothetical protein
MFHVRPVAARLAGLVAPRDRLGVRMVAGVACIGEDIADMVQHDVENDIQALPMCGIDEGAQFVVRGGRIVGEPGFGMEKVMDAVPVIGLTCDRQVLQHRAEPDRAGAEHLDVGKLRTHAAELAALVAIEVRIVERRMRWGLRGVEAVDHEEINRAVAPVGRRRERRRCARSRRAAVDRLEIGIEKTVERHGPLCLSRLLCATPQPTIPLARRNVDRRAGIFSGLAT